jgi:hypothetical protein
LVPIKLLDKIIVNYCKLLFFQASEGGEGARNRRSKEELKKVSKRLVFDKKSE